MCQNGLLVGYAGLSRRSAISASKWVMNCSTLSWARIRPRYPPRPPRWPRPRFVAHQVHRTSRNHQQALHRVDGARNGDQNGGLFGPPSDRTRSLAAPAPRPLPQPQRPPAPRQPSGQLVGTSPKTLRPTEIVLSAAPPPSSPWHNTLMRELTDEERARVDAALYEDVELTTALQTTDKSPSPM